MAVISNNISEAKVLIDFSGDRTIKTNRFIGFYSKMKLLDITKIENRIETIRLLTEYLQTNELTLWQYHVSD